MDGLSAFLQESVLLNTCQRSDRIRFSLKPHRFIRILPVPEHAKTNEIFSLPIYLLPSELSTERTKFCGLYSLSMQLLDLVFNWQTMAVPSRDIGCIKTSKRFGFDNNIFKDLVNGMTNMDITIGIRWAIMQDKRRSTLSFLSNFLVQTVNLPLFNPKRLALR